MKSSRHSRTELKYFLPTIGERSRSATDSAASRAVDGVERPVGIERAEVITSVMVGLRVALERQLVDRTRGGPAHGLRRPPSPRDSLAPAHEVDEIGATTSHEISA